MLSLRTVLLPHLVSSCHPPSYGTDALHAHSLRTLPSEVYTLKSASPPGAPWLSCLYLWASVPFRQCFSGVWSQLPPLSLRVHRLCFDLELHSVLQVCGPGLLSPRFSLVSSQALRTPTCHSSFHLASAHVPSLRLFEYNMQHMVNESIPPHSQTPPPSLRPPHRHCFVSLISFSLSFLSSCPSLQLAPPPFSGNF